MIDYTTLYKKVDDNKFYASNGVKEVEVKEKFPSDYWDDPEAFKMAGIRGYEPMTAKELETEEVQDEKLKDSSYYIEEKFDGTRALVYFMSQADIKDNEVGFCRVFSRRISKKTGFYVENSDSVPQIRDIDVPELSGTILDGEMFIDGLPFKEVSSTLNCLWDKAVERQLEKGFISLHAFDILFYHGVDLRRFPLSKRKVFLHLAVQEANSAYIKEVPYYECGVSIPVTFNKMLEERVSDKLQYLKYLKDHKESYPNLYSFYNCRGRNLTPRAYYEFIVSTGGEGLIVKPKNGFYLHKRGWEYSKIKKFLTRELIVLGFDEPTREYTGKDVKRWGFWVDEKNKRVMGNFYGDSKYTPVTKFYFYNQVGNLLLAVLIPKEDYDRIPKNKQGEKYTPSDFELDPRLNEEYYLMEVCECAGFDDETREEFTKNRNKMVGTVVEVKANELFRDSGKMRHPRFMRVRFDKDPEMCVWQDHIGVSEVTL